jgi:dCTP diphosphatase
MTPTVDSLQDLTERLARFAQARNWQTFHSPKNLASALIVEAAELLEHFQWLTEEQSRQLNAQTRRAVGEEVADVLLYLVQLASVLGIDAVAEAQRKIELNEQRYPVESAWGNSRKHDPLANAPDTPTDRGE